MKYRISLTIDAKDLPGILSTATIAAAFERSQVALSLLPDSEALPIHSTHPAQATTAPRTRAKKADGADWPPEKSIYGVVLAALKGEPRNPNELREALTKAGFATGSLNSAIVRLEKANKITKSGDGAWMAA